MGSSAAITVRVATTVGLPTSATASIAACIAVAAVAHGPMAGDVLDHHDRVVDQDADGEDQREQADAVDGVAHQLEAKSVSRMVVGITTSVTSASRQPIAKAISTTIETVARPGGTAARWPCRWRSRRSRG